MANKIFVNGTQVNIATLEEKDYITLTDMLKAKDGDFLFRIGFVIEIQSSF